MIGADGARSGILLGTPAGDKRAQGPNACFGTLLDRRDVAGAMSYVC
jgi:hypothetical protein